MIENLATTLIEAVYFFLPAYVGNTAAGLLGRGRPVDLGRNFIDGRRILGDGVTVRGTIMGIVSGALVGAVQGDILLGFLLGTGAMLGDAAGSFLKRRLAMPRGAPAPLLDQLNFVVGGLAVAALFGYGVPWSTVFILFLITPFAHLTVNKIGYALKLKDVPW